MPITITRPQYDALLALATAQDAAAADTLRRAIDAANSIRRYVLNIRWLNLGGEPPARVSIQNWPPSQTYRLEMERPITREDVESVFANSATNPIEAMVTPDPAGNVGWTLVDAYDFASGAR